MSPRAEQITRWSLHLPYPRPPLSLNDRMHWAQRNRISRQIKDDVQILARATRVGTGLARVWVGLTWVPPDRRRRDTDNMAPTLKACIDGLTAYGLVPDDDSAHVRSMCTITAPPVPPLRPGVWLEIVDMDGEGLS